MKVSSVVTHAVSGAQRLLGAHVRRVAALRFRRSRRVRYTPQVAVGHSEGLHVQLHSGRADVINGPRALEVPLHAVGLVELVRVQLQLDLVRVTHLRSSSTSSLPLSLSPGGTHTGDCTFAAVQQTSTPPHLLHGREGAVADVRAHVQRGESTRCC